MKITVVIDTNILISSCIKKGGLCRKIISMCLLRKIQPIIGSALFSEYEDVISRKKLFSNSLISSSEREILFNAFLSVCKWTKVFFLWRPNLKDEADNHLIELAVAGNATFIITKNKKDFKNSELYFPDIKIYSPEEFFKEGLCQH